MSYFIGVLIFVATLATTDPAFAADHVMPIHDANKELMLLFLSIIISFLVLGIMLSKRTTDSALTNQLLPRHITRDYILGTIWGAISGVIFGFASGWPILGVISGVISGVILGGTGSALNITFGAILGAIFGFFIAMSIAFIGVMYDTTWLAIFCDLFGTKGKKDTLIFIGGMIGGKTDSSISDRIDVTWYTGNINQDFDVYTRYK